jgi:hypothetical protein
MVIFGLHFLFLKKNSFDPNPWQYNLNFLLGCYLPVKRHRPAVKGGVFAGIHIFKRYHGGMTDPVTHGILI